MFSWNYKYIIVIENRVMIKPGLKQYGIEKEDKALEY